MAILVLYGSSVADATLTNAGDMALTTTGGTETSKTTTSTGTNLYVEVFALGGSSTGATSIPATPTGKGWVYKPGAGTFATGNWGAVVTFSSSASFSTAGTLTVRFFKYSGGTYTSIGNLPAKAATPSAKTAFTMTATSMSSVTFGANDLLYVDIWGNDPSNINGDNPTVWESTSATAGVANDVQITTSNFTPAVALASTLAGAGTLAGTTTQVTALASTLAGAGTLTATTQLATALAATLAGTGTLVGTLTTTGVALTGQLDGVGTLTGTYQLSLALADTCTGAGQLSGTLSAALSLAGSSLAGAATLLGAVSLGAALLDTVAGTSQLSGTPAYATQLARSLAGTGQLSGTLLASNVYFANPGDNLQTKAQALIAGDTLILNDGTYSTSPGLNFSAINGTASAPITIRAANDGMAILDGGGTFVPLFLTNCSYVTIQGLRVQNSSGSVVYLFGGSGSGNGPVDHITLQRITAHGTGPQNTHVFAISHDSSLGPPTNITNILVEDCAAWGPGRYLFSAFEADVVTFRRCYGYWTTITDTLQEPRAPFNIYGTSNAIMENCIGRNAMPYQVEANNNYFAACWHTSLAAYVSNNCQILGCIFYGNYDGYWLNDDVGSPTTFKDCYFETPQPPNTTFTNKPYGEGWRSNGPAAAQSFTLTNCVFRNCVTGLNHASNLGTMTLSNSIFIDNVTGITNDSGHDHCDWFNNTSNGTTPGGTDKTVDPGWAIATYGKGGAMFIPAASPLKGAGASGADIGANILYQYVDGTLTTTPLWPWPMEARILAELGQSPTYAANGGPWTTLAGLYPTGGGAVLTLYGSSVADATLTNACDMALNTTGGTETSKTTTSTGGNLYVEVLTQGGASSGASAIPATPTGHGWVYQPGAGVFAIGNWNAIFTASSSGSFSTAGTYTVRFFKYASGVYTSIGTLPAIASTANGITTYTCTPTSMPSVPFGANDLVYVDMWAYDPANINGDNPTIYVSTSATQGVLDDMQITTASFTPAVALAGTLTGSGTLSGTLTVGVSIVYIPRALSALLVLTVTALTDTLAGAGTLSGTVSLSTVLTGTLSGTGTIAGPLSASLTLSGTNLVGVGALAGTVSLTAPLVGTLSGAGTLAGSGQFAPALTATLTGVGQLSGTSQLATSLGTTIAGGATLTGTLAAALPLASVTCTGAGTLAATVGLTTALLTTYAGVGTLQAGPLTARLTLPGVQFSGVGTSAATMGLAAVLGTTCTGTSTLSGTMAAAVALPATFLSGIGTSAYTMSLATSLTGTLPGTGMPAGTAPTLKTALANSIVGTGQLSGTISGGGALTTTVAGTSSLSSTFSLATTLAGSLAGTGTLAGAAPTLKTALSCTIASVGQLSGVLSSGGALTGTLSGVSSCVGVFSLSTTLAGSTAGAGTLAVTLSARIALTNILGGTGSIAGTLFLMAAYQATLAGTSTLSGVSVRASYLIVALPGSSGLSGTSTRVTLLTCVYTGVGQLSPALVIGGALAACIFTGISQCTGALSFPGPSATATWKTRDMKATWKTRDMKATWVTRDDKATWKTRR